MHTNTVKNCFYNKGSTLAENIRYLMYKYDITINGRHQSLTYVIKKVYTYYNDRTIPIVMIHGMPMLLERTWPTRYIIAE